MGCNLAFICTMSYNLLCVNGCFISHDLLAIPAAVLSDTSGLGETLKKRLEALNVWLSVKVKKQGLQSDISAAAWLLKTCYYVNNMGAECKRVEN